MNTDELILTAETNVLCLPVTDSLSMSSSVKMKIASIYAISCLSICLERSFKRLSVSIHIFFQNSASIYLGPVKLRISQNTNPDFQ